jgi:serine/threonine protein kinase
MDVINCGRFGTVYKAHDPIRNKLVAIKKLPKTRHDMTEHANAHMLNNEKAILERVNGHPNVIAYLGDYEDAEYQYLVTEYCAHGNLNSSIAYNEREMRFYMKQLLSGLQHIHNCGVVHTDIKPANILLGSLNRVKITDFGHSQLNLTGGKCCGCFSAFGTPWYAAPEMAEKDYGSGVDVWAAGVVAFGMLFPGCHPYQENDANIKWPFKPSKECVEFIELCLDKNKNGRITANEALSLPFFKGVPYKGTVEA